MSRRPKKKVQQQLGRAFEKDKNRKNRVVAKDERHSEKYVEENKQSIFDVNDIDTLMEIAMTTHREFEVEKERQVVLTTQSFVVPEKMDPRQIEEMDKNWNKLKIPRRPPWSVHTTPEELNFRERESFLVWRRKLAALEENEHLLLTPFEKNLEVWRQLWRVVERSQLVVQIVDARNPMLFRSVDLERWVETFEGKKNLLVVNKSDMLTLEQRKIWARVFKEDNIEYLFFSAFPELVEERNIREEGLQLFDSDSISVEEEDDLEEIDYKIYGAQELMDYFDAICSTLPNIQDDDERHVVGMVGYPNVGKSSTINLLYGEKAVAVSSTPGKTKHFQTIMLPETNITLCDCPGLVFPSFMSTKAEMLCNGLLRIDEMREPIAPTSLVCRRIPKEILESFYGIILPLPGDGEDPDRAPTPDELLASYAYVRGYTTAKGHPDRHRAARYILKDFMNGVLLYCHPPNGIDADDFNRTTFLRYESQLKVKKPKKQPNVQQSTEQTLLGETPENPNMRFKKGKGKKIQRREKEKLRGQKRMQVGGYHGTGSLIPGQALPTSLKLEKRRN